MEQAGTTNVTGEYIPEFYSAIRELYKSKDTGMFGIVEPGVRPDSYRGRNTKPDQNKRMLVYHLKNILFGSCSNFVFHKTNVLGFYNEDVSAMCDFLREIEDVQIVFLTRPIDKIIESWKRSDLPLGYEDSFRNALECQDEQFRQAFELGDIDITFDDVVSNPMETLLKIGCSYYPNKEVIERVMKVKTP